jgi:hypothetical protein
MPKDSLEEPSNSFVVLLGRSGGAAELRQHVAFVRHHKFLSVQTAPSPPRRLNVINRAANSEESGEWSTTLLAICHGAREMGAKPILVAVYPKTHGLSFSF